MQLKIGDKVRVDGKESYVTGSWGAGRHMMWKLEDGREIVDLHVAVANGSVAVIPSQTQTSGDSKTTHVSKLLRFPKENEEG